MSHRHAAAWALLVSALGSAQPALGQESARVTTQSLHQALAMEIETKDFQTPMTLRDAVQLFYEKFGAQGKDVPVIVDMGSFRQDHPDLADLWQAQVSLHNTPKRLQFSRALQQVVDQLPAPASILVRNGAIEIVSRESTTLPVMLFQKVLTRFDRTPLSDAVRQLSETSGVSVIVDPRVDKKKDAAITAEFRGDITLESALRLVANMADLKIVLMDRGVFVTTPENAATLERELEKRRRDREAEADQDPDPRRRAAGAAVSAR